MAVKTVLCKLMKAEKTWLCMNLDGALQNIETRKTKHGNKTIERQRKVVEVRF
jgi:hypothetical protein